MSTIGLIFPHQLFEENILILKCKTIYLVEEWLFFRQYKFHKRKIAYHRTSMKFYENYLRSKRIEVVYIDSIDEQSDIRKLLPYLKSQGLNSIQYIDPTDNWLENRIINTCAKHQIKIHKYPNPSFLNSSEENTAFFKSRKRMFQADFYKYQRQSKDILVDHHRNPIGGKWSFDEDNRLKYPKGKVPPKIEKLSPNKFWKEAVEYTKINFADNCGSLNNDYIYPTTFDESKDWLKAFFTHRFAEFGAYEDAILTEEHFLHHSVLTPMLNVGLLIPKYVVDQALNFSEDNDIPMNSMEGFIRQIIGWREFIRAVYELRGSDERTRNYWGFSRKIPESFWNGSTGIDPIDLTIKKVLETGYCHHIERLMVLGNFMLLCEFDPDDVYRWFMELFIDSYDWVMVPNVYGMSQFADGGLMSTKPYISGSNYLMKMSDYKKGDWQQVWDGLFWRFMHIHRDFFLQNPRLSMLIRSFDKMDKEKQMMHLDNAEKFLGTL